jgi:hypothetical protein
VDAPKPSRRQILVAIGGIAMAQSIRAFVPADAGSPAIRLTVVSEQIRLYDFDEAAVGSVAARTCLERSRQRWPAALCVSWA